MHGPVQHEDKEEELECRKQYVVYTIWVGRGEVEQCFPSGEKHTNTAMFTRTQEHTHSMLWSGNVQY